MEETELVKALKMVIETQAALIKELSSRPHAPTVYLNGYPQYQVGYPVFYYNMGGTLQGQVANGQAGGGGAQTNGFAHNQSNTCINTNLHAGLSSGTMALVQNG